MIQVNHPSLQTLRVTISKNASSEACLFLNGKDSLLLPSKPGSQPDFTFQGKKMSFCESCSF